MQLNKITMLLWFILMTTTIKAQDPSFLWAKQFGGKSVEYSSSLALDASKNIYMIGAFVDTADFNPGPGVNNLISAGNFDVFVAKMDSSGNYLWAKRIGGTILDYGFNIVVDDASNVYINGYVNGIVDLDPGAGTFLTTSTGLNAFIVKLNTNGDFIWGKQWTSNGTTAALKIYFNSMILAKDGGIIAGGQFGGTVDFNPDTAAAAVANKTSLGGLDAFFFKLDSAGNYQWAKSQGSTSDDKVNGIAIDTSGNIYLTGSFAGTVDFNPSAVVFNLASLGGYDIYIQKLDTGANFIWTKKIGGSSSEYPAAIAVDRAGSVFTTGRFSGTVDFDPGAATHNYISHNGSDDVFVLKLDKNGNFGFADFDGDTLADWGFAIKTDLHGNVYVAGLFAGTVDFSTQGPAKNFTSSNGSDIFLYKLDSTGKLNWFCQATSTGGGERANCIILDQQENVYTNGYFAGTMDADPGSGVSNLVGLGSFDVFIQKLSQANANNIYCNGATTLTNCSGTIDDGSGSGKYGNNQNCSWLIQPTNATSINVFLNSFDTEINFDKLYVYDGPNASSPLIGTYSGYYFPPYFVSSGPSLYFVFTTDAGVVYNGFSISYTCNVAAAPVADFAASSLNIVAGSSVNFSDSSTNLPTSWNWTFTGATPAASTLQDPPNIAYLTPGCYDVKLKATNIYGVDSVTKTCMINVTAPSACSELIISEYVEGSGSNKAIELFNTSTSIINLSQYQLKLFSNGNTTSSSTFTLSGNLAPFQTYVVANPAASTGMLALANATSNLCSFNGNDAVVLQKNGVNIDIVGIVGNDPGTSWSVPGGSTIDHTLVRKTSVEYPSTAWAVVQNQWNVNAQDVITNLGLHSSNCIVNASFTYSPQPTCENYSTTFTNMSTNATSYSWSFQNATPATSTQKNPVVQFLSSGLKTVMLIAYNGTYTDTVTVQINVGALPNATITPGGPTSFCSGGSVTFNANTGAGLSYQWQKNLTNITGATANNYTTTTAGDYRVVVTNAAGCQTASGIVAVTVYSKPQAVVTANGSVAICAGGSVQLSASTGINYTYKWKKDNVTIVGATASTYTVTVAGVYKAVVTNANGCSKTSNAITVTINTPTATITVQGPVTVCNGTGVTMKANTGTGLTYQWRKGSNNITGATDSVYTAYISGTYKVVVTNTCGTATSTGIVVTVNPVPTATINAGGPTTICNGDSVTMTANTGSGLTYQWKKNAANITGQTSSTYKATATGTYTVLITNANGCTSLSNAITVTVNSVAASVTASGPTTFCNGDSVVLTANSGANLTYQWLKSNANITGATAISYSAKTAGTYRVRVTNSVSGCTKSSSGVQVVINCKEGFGENIFEVTANPNPFTHCTSLSLRGRNDEPVTVRLMNAEGKLIEEIFSESNETITLGEQIPAGFYIAVVANGNEQRKLRLVKF